jgi:hypothetical protein
VGPPGEITRAIQGRFTEAIQGKRPEYREWLDVVEPEAAGELEEQQRISRAAR